MKRILHIVGSMNRAGAETMVMNLYRNIDLNKFQFDFLYFSNKECDYDTEILQLGGKIYRISTTKVAKRYYEYYKLLKSHKEIDVVHSHMNINNSIYLWVASLAGVKTRISHSHGTEGKYHQSFFRKLYKKNGFGMIKKYATKYIACGKAAGKYLYPYVNENQIEILPNAIDVDKFVKSRADHRGYIKKMLNLNEDTLILTQIGRLTTVKNHKFSLSLCKYLKEQNVNFHYVVIGDGELRSELENQAVSENLMNETTFLGIRSDVSELLSGSDCVLMPSFHEGFPVVLVESQAIGVPSVISNNISPEVDLGLDLVTFVPLEEDYSIWYDKIKSNIEKKSVKPERIIQIMNQKGFNIEGSAKKLEKIYG